MNKFKILDGSGFGNYHRPAVAYDSHRNVWLLACTRKYVDPRDDAVVLTDIVVQQLDTSGEPIGNLITVAEAASQRAVLPDPIVRVHYNPIVQEYFVLWEYMYSFYDLDIRARRLDPDGNLIGNELAIAYTRKHETSPALSYNSQDNEYLVVLEYHYSENDLDIRARRVAANGSPINGFVIAQSLHHETHPVVAYNSIANEYLAAYEYWYSENNLDIKVRRLAADGTYRGDPVSIAQSLHHETHPVVAYNSVANEYLVVYEYWYSENDLDIYARRLNGNGSPIGDKIRIANSWKGETRPKVLFNQSQNEYLVVWEHRYSESNYDYDIYARRLTGNCQFIGNELKLVTSSWCESSPDATLDSNNNRYLLVWQNWNQNTYNGDIYGGMLTLATRASQDKMMAGAR